MKGLASAGITYTPKTASAVTTNTTASSPVSIVQENKLRLQIRVKDQAVRYNLCRATEIEGRDRVNKAIQTCPELHAIKI